MRLAALIAAYHEAGAPDGGLRATLPLAGRTLIERQARLAASAGAVPIVVLVERLPPELTMALDRLRSEGVAVTIARSASDAAEAVHPDDRLLLVADGLIADEAHIARLLGAGSSTILTIPDHGLDERFERIDGQSRWAGLAVLTGQALKQTAAMLKDWDLQSTLLRRAVQSGARQFSLRGDGLDAYLTIATTRAELVPVERQIIEGAAARRDGWVSRYLLGPAEKRATRLLMPTRVMPEWLRGLAVTLTGLGAWLFARHLLWEGGLLVLLATPLDDVADRLATLRMQRSDENNWWQYLHSASAAAALLVLAWALSGTEGWGCFALAGAVLAFLAALRVELAGGREVPGKILLAERKGMVWIMLPFGATGNWLAGLLVLAGYAAASFFWAQRQLHRPIPAAEQD